MLNIIKIKLYIRIHIKKFNHEVRISKQYYTLNMIKYLLICEEKKLIAEKYILI